MEELMKHRGHKEKDHHHHHMHLFHLPGHHHHHKDQPQQTVSVEKYREVSSSIDEIANAAHSSAAINPNLKLTVGRIA